MTRRFSLWWLAAVPATLFGHALIYALSGRTQADPSHAYALPTLEFSVALLAAFCSALLLLALGGGSALAAQRSSWAGTWAKLAIVQALLFTVLERFEGHQVAPQAYAAQLIVALLAALAIAGFMRVVHSCERSARHAGKYLRRGLGASHVTQICGPVRSPAYALAVTAGTARFQRPPPRL